MPEVGGYDMHLYCQNGCDGGEPDQYFEQTREQCRRKARNNGWTFHRDGEVTCSACSGKKPKPKKFVKQTFMEVPSGKMITKTVEVE